MKTLLKEPILRYVMILTLTFIFSLVLLIGTNIYWEKKYSKAYEDTLYNEQARMTLGRIIQEKILQLQLGLEKVSTAEDVRDIRVVRNSITKPANSLSIFFYKNLKNHMLY
ncbi:hypothetical protein [Bacillus sp. FJAT-45350]|uniref:hypothetical protein n=1 Tax=Bacillus sp. FJAT-45350 TaxID=2011014 RepID=UPI000BB7006B|nr:hypothetical protein [Bacillus sp. FJAT-45350]